MDEAMERGDAPAYRRLREQYLDLRPEDFPDAD
jgi:hypothetical protein